MYKTYKNFILENKLEDSKESYQKYVLENDQIYHMMNDEMKKQYIDVNFPLRFTPNTIKG